MDSVNVTIRVEREVRDAANELFDELGVNITQAVNMFLKQAIRERRIPFEVTAQPQVRYAVMRIEEGEGHGE
ncbi:type II toxin-antitoxin system RelB/DinJ family antitoxin [Ellagibacter isourolithinifaciens]|uniref:type II toxin-antitoxin system RelB/DinJ family antitoxin n=1 Tax=Ellagibacter isourolithinifaciens TaxID=2137581 RepID=UPI0023F08C30|nr:type II toxin-antitoxin system RelB/DinJ family antitoxin [Ellagibacter isourolithinifaciens]MDD5924776.1 type II toxin-antitoxin system RelB/DinJ family antitoxin [Ellagibacter isourolithinifaciens]